MSATYDITLPTDKDKIRNALADIDMTEPLRQDEEYLSQIALFGLAQATINEARSLAAEYAQAPVSVSLSGISVSWPDRVKTWLAIADNLQKLLLDITDQGVLRSVKTVRPGYDCPAEYVRPLHYDIRGYYGRYGWRS